MNKNVNHSTKNILEEAQNFVGEIMDGAIASATRTSKELRIWINKQKEELKKRKETIKQSEEEYWKKNQRNINTPNEIFQNKYYAKYFIEEKTKEIPEPYQEIFKLMDNIIEEEFEKIYIELAELLKDYYQYVTYLNNKNDTLEKKSEQLLKPSNPQQKSKVMESFRNTTKELEKTRYNIHKIIEQMKEILNEITKKNELGKNINNLEISEEHLKQIEKLRLPSELEKRIKKSFQAYIKMRLACFREVEKQAKDAVIMYQKRQLSTYQNQGRKILTHCEEAEYYETGFLPEVKAIELELYALAYDVLRYGLKTQTNNYFKFLNLSPKTILINHGKKAYEYYDFQLPEQVEIDEIGMNIMNIISHYLETKTIKESDLNYMYVIKDWLRKSPYEHFVPLLENYWNISEQDRALSNIQSTHLTKNI